MCRRDTQTQGECLAIVDPSSMGLFVAYPPLWTGNPSHVKVSLNPIGRVGYMGKSLFLWVGFQLIRINPIGRDNPIGRPIGVAPSVVSN